MPKLPRVKPKNIIRAFIRAGFVVDRIHGSHHILYKNDRQPPIAIPVHNRDLKPGTLRNILRTAKITVEELIDLL